jgi:hypothetical protein
MFFLGVDLFIFERVAEIVALFPFLCASSLRAHAHEAYEALATGIRADGVISPPWSRDEWWVAECLIEDEVFSKAIAWGESLSNLPMSYRPR